MKSFLISLFIIASQLAVFAQDCMTSEYLKKGTKWEVTNQDKKGKTTGIVKYEVLNSSQTGGQYIWEIKVATFDKKGEPLNEGSSEIICENGIYKMDMSQMMPPETMQSLKDLEVEIESTTINFPRGEDVETQLEDAYIVIATSAAMGLMDMKMTISNRKIEGIETITTEAGTFKCLKITQDNKIENKMMSRKYRTVSWFLPGFGVIKTESYDQKENLMGTSTLSSLTR